MATLAADALTQPGSWIALALSYLLGAVPFGILVARLVGGQDPRKVGSGNIGATNTARALGRGWGLVTLALDVAKGAVPTLFIAPAFGGDSLAVGCGLAAVLGHCFPVWLRFRGGKGVATAVGVVVALDPRVFAVGMLLWLLSAALTRFVSLSSMLLALGFVGAGMWLHGPSSPLALGMLFLAVLILVKHRTNIARLAAGTEPRLGRKTTGSADPTP